MRKQLLTLDHLVQLMDPKLYLHLQKADSTNFFFFFRMLLVWYKREFEWADVLRLWESLWTDFYSSNFHIFIALAILEKHRDVIMAHLQHFDEVLKYGECMNYACFILRYIADARRSQRSLRNYGSRIDSHPSRVIIPTLPAHRRDDRQERQFPLRTTGSPTQIDSIAAYIARTI